MYEVYNREMRKLGFEPKTLCSNYHQGKANYDKKKRKRRHEDIEARPTWVEIKEREYWINGNKLIMVSTPTVHNVIW